MKAKHKESKEIVEIYRIAAQMADSDLSQDFIVGAVHLAEYYPGARDLLHLWSEENDSEERDQIIADIQEEVDAHHLDEKPETSITKKVVKKIEDADALIEKIVKFKKELRLKVDKWGGVTKLAEVTGIPQPSLSRFFSSVSMPRGITVVKIFKCIGAERELDNALLDIRR